VELNLLSVLKESGLSACLALAIFTVMFWLIKNIMKDHRDERKNYQTIISEHMVASAKSIDNLGDKLNEYSKVQRETCTYVREEHREILKALMNLNGHAK